jgi:CRP/FNR family cyclic AMP-dependent transcriptional regulator
MTSELSAAEIYGRDFPAGAVVFEEGDPGSRMYVIQSGEVRIVKRVGTRDITLARLGAGEAFGEMALLEGQPRSATAVVEAAARILVIDEAAFADLVRKNGEIALRLLRRLSARLREANRQIRNFLSADTMGRAVEVLRALAGAPDESGFRPIPPEIGSAALAARAGAGAAEADLWLRLRRCRLVREVGTRAQLAPAEVVDSFLRYVDLRTRYEALAAGELSEAPDLRVEPAEGIAAELLHARLGADGGVAGGPATAEFQDYLALRRRFEPDEPPPRAPESGRSAP